MNEVLILKVKNYCKSLLEQSRCRLLQFHNYAHTKSVVQTADRLALAMDVSDEEREWLVIAAYFHDVGNLEITVAHETVSCTMARKFLEMQNYDAANILIIEKIILATEINRTPVTLLEKIICDADLAHLGKSSFVMQNRLLREEWAVFLDKTFTDTEWFHLNEKFLNDHYFYTPVAQSLYAEQKKENLQKLKQLSMC